MSFFFANPFDEAVDKATSENLPIGTEDLPANLDIADQVKSKAVSGKTAAASLKRRINHKNPNVQLLALKLTDTCVKNCGQHFVVEVASKEFVDNLVSIVRATGTNPDVRKQVLALIQSWGLALNNKLDSRYVTEIYEYLKRDGIQFPPIERTESSSVMIETTTAPEWTDSELCMRCRTLFTTFNRKHHCRNCGQTYCGQCSSKNMALPHLGIMQDVRVCDTCHQKLSSRSGGTSITTGQQWGANSNPYPGSGGGGNAPAGVDSMSKEDADIQKAIALSLAAAKESGGKVSSQPTRPKPKPREDVSEDDADMKAAIAASLQDLRSSSSESKPDRPSYDYKSPDYVSRYDGQEPSRTTTPATTTYPTAASSTPTPQTNPNELSSVELENMRLFSELVERTESDVQTYGLGVLTNSQIQTLYAQIATMQPKLARSVDDTRGQYAAYWALNEELTGAVKMYDAMLGERLGVRAPAAGPAVAGYTQGYAPGYPPESYASHHHQQQAYPPQQQQYAADPSAAAAQPYPQQPPQLQSEAGYYAQQHPPQQAYYDPSQTPPPQQQQQPGQQPPHPQQPAYYDPNIPQQQQQGPGSVPPPQQQQQQQPGYYDPNLPPQQQQGHVSSSSHPPSQGYNPSTQQQPPQQQHQQGYYDPTIQGSSPPPQGYTSPQPPYGSPQQQPYQQQQQQQQQQQMSPPPLQQQQPPQPEPINDAPLIEL
ncbi:hypothetical protein DFS34DRAFT_697023 [Phlyctochytrium arcticum]|nr:hypothetical protein DFS34DRAFT_697023 [Phlyctochytrium arcticum]